MQVHTGPRLSWVPFLRFGGGGDESLSSAGLCISHDAVSVAIQRGPSLGLPLCVILTVAVQSPISLSKSMRCPPLQHGPPFLMGLAYAEAGVNRSGCD